MCSPPVTLVQIGTESFSNPFTNEIPIPFPMTKLNLRSYVVKGYPCTAGVPNDTFLVLDLQVNSSSVGSSWVGPTGQQGIKLFLEANGFTHHHSNGNNFVGFTGNIPAGTLKLTGTVKTPTGSLATFDSFWIVCELPNK
jgi:hypothetical protein